MEWGLISFLAIIICCLLSFFARPIARSGGRWAPAVAAGVLAAIATVLMALDSTPPGTVRVDLVITLPLLLAAWIQFFRQALRATAEPDEPDEQLEADHQAPRYLSIRMALWAGLLTFIVFPVIAWGIAMVNPFEPASGARLLLIGVFVWPALIGLQVFGNEASVFVLAVPLQYCYCYAIAAAITWLRARFRRTP